MPDELEKRRIPYFGDFALFDEIGRGGMGVVYNAQQTKLDRPVALKVLHSSFGTSGGGVQRLRVEAEAIARLDHPNIVPIFEFGEHEGHPYLAMQLVEGKSLAEHIREGGLDLKERDVALLMGKIARAVHHAHQRGVLHRDLKPGNILLDKSGEPHLIDFGLAKCLEQDAGITQTGVFLGTPAYTSPEQAAGQNKSVTTASDIYSLGAILYALLTGQPPFVGESTAETIAKVKSGALRRPRSLRPTLSINLETICLKCLEKEPARRYSSALRFAEDLEHFLEGRPIAARPVGALARLWMWTRRNPVPAALGITVCLGVLSSAIVGVFLWRKFQAKEMEARNSSLRHDLFLEMIQVARLSPRNEGWSEQAWSRAGEATKIQPIVKLGELRNQAAALLAGLDAHRVEALPAPARVGPQAFAKTGVPLLCDTNRLVFFLPGAVNSQTNREWIIPPHFGAKEVEKNFAHEGTLMPDGSSVLAVLGLADGEAALAVLQSNLVSVIETMSVYPSSVSIASDGSLVAAGEPNGEVRVWSLRDGRCVARLPVGRSPVGCLALKQTSRVRESKNGRADNVEACWLLAVGDASGNLSVWDLRTQTAKAHFRGAQFLIGTVAFSPDGTILASGGSGPVKLWETATGRELLELNSGFDIRTLNFSLDGKYLAVNWDGTNTLERVKVWEMEYGRGIQTLRGLSAPVSKLCLSPDGKRLAALSHNWDVGLWDMATGQLMHIFEVPRGLSADNAALAFSPTSDRLAFSTASHGRLWDVPSGSELRSWVVPSGLGDVLTFPDPAHLILLHWVRAGSTWQIHNLLGEDFAKPIAEIRDFAGFFVAEATPDGKSFVVEGLRAGAGARRRIIRSFEVLTGKERWTVGSTKTYHWGAIVPDATSKFVVLHIDDSQKAALVELASGATTKTLPWLPGGASPDANRYAVISSSRFPASCSVFIDKLESPAVTLGIDITAVNQTAKFDTAGNKLAWGNTDGTVTVGDLKEINERLRRVRLEW